MAEKEIKTFSEFWPYYLGEHRLPRNRALHYIGTVLSSVLIITMLAFQIWWLLPLILVAGYGPAWIGHFFLERNRPATFTYPLWSLAADYKMFYFALTGRLKNEWPKYF
ncbi:DUF962 domain-containing protein [Kangiella sediminilitoris]|uniref:Transmembrane protein n=1 Tax=Kangiella sediminilitoris TaxID=1144748 RepID=A0A1B3B882_9GAMM|nr:DUF962 domain-containing protein [Kangiella sediminilitoris]AOE49008.1 hypothetical protein KS2013_281 [Kangiella sediminilitoris]